ncbi:hypothetical protein [Acinetobacter sp. YH01012]|uniref:hypothetical protein n=1 Tax=Acinetobacter sp. YH01012 TaxID=2601028 RepID=UPI0015D2462F|nr:hypothetical protein [Acinetobacter sp. YH01012]
MKIISLKKPLQIGLCNKAIANEENKIIGIKTLARFFEISYVSFVHPETQRNDMERNVEFTFLGMSTKDSRVIVFIDVVP